MKIRPVGS